MNLVLTLNLISHLICFIFWILLLRQPVYYMYFLIKSIFRHTTNMAFVSFLEPTKHCICYVPENPLVLFPYTFFCDCTYKYIRVYYSYRFKITRVSYIAFIEIKVNSVLKEKIFVLCTLQTFIAYYLLFYQINQERR